MSLKHIRKLRAIGAILRMSKGKLPRRPCLAGYNPNTGHACGYGGGDEDHSWAIKKVTAQDGAAINKVLDSNRSIRTRM